MARTERTTSLMAAFLAGVAFVVTPAAGQTTPAPAPLTPPTPAVRPASSTAPLGESPSRASTPALDQLNRETVALYERLQGSVMRVQMPTPVWVDNAVKQEANRWNKYKNLPPDIRNKLQQSRGGYGNYNNDADQSPSVQQRQTPGEQRPNSPEPSSSPPSQPSQPSQLPQPAPPESPRQGAMPNEGQPIGNSPNRGQLPGQAGGQPAANDNWRQNYGQQPVQVPGNTPGGNTNPQHREQQAKEYVLVVPQQPAAQQADGNAQQQQQLFVDNRGGNWNLNRAAQAEAFVPNWVGLLLDDQGHVLVPTYIEREAVGETPVKLAVGDAVEPLEARFVGSDEQTQLTVLKLAPPPEAKGRNEGKAAARKPALGKPIQLARKRLPDGSLVVLLSPTDGVGRLTVWNGGTKETGVVVTIDGEVAGIARFGQFLSGPACRLIADHIIRHGMVRRATLGVIVTQLDPADPIRQQLEELADRPALHVDQVVKGSVAERGGLRVGDLLLAIGSEPVHDIPSLAAVIAGRNGPTTLRILRDGKPLSATVDLSQNDAVLTK